MDINSLIQETISQSVRERINNSEGIWEEIPVSPEEFFSVWLPPELSEPQLEVFNSLFSEGKEWSNEFKEYLLFWGEGAGKDFICVRIILYTAYWLMCLKDPQGYFGFHSGEDIDLVNVSMNASHASNVFFKRFTSALRRVRNPNTGKNWFEEKGMDLRDKKDIQTKKVSFLKNITAHSLNSEKDSAEGKNILMAVFDEVATFKPHKAKEFYDNLFFTAESRWGSTEGAPFRIILISYLRDENDFMNYRWKQSKQEDDVFRSKKCTWEVRPDKKREDYNKAYNKNPEEAAKRFENILMPGMGNAFFAQKHKIRENINLEREFPYTNKKIINIDDLNELEFENWFRPNIIERIYKLKDKQKTKEEKKELLRLIRLHNDSEYFIHIDLATGQEGADCVGFAMGHPIKIYDEEDESQIHVYIDLMMQLKSKVGEVDFDRIRQFIYTLIEEGFYIRGVSLDGYQSKDFIQQVSKKQIDCKLISVDRDDSAYQTLKELIYTNRIDYYGYCVFLRELEELIRENRKVDHPDISNKRSLEEGTDKGSKDVSDAVAGIVKNIMEKTEKEYADVMGV